MNALCQKKKDGINTRAHIAIKEQIPRLPTRSVDFLKQLRHGDSFRRLHVLHMVRDPRAYLAAQKFRKWFPPPHAPARSRGRLEGIAIMQRCKETMNNLYLMHGKQRKKRAKKDNLRYLLLRYEDLMMTPIKESVRLSRFLDLNLSSRFVQFFTASEKKRSGGTSQLEMNPIILRNVRNSMNKWRHRVSWEFVRKVQKSCGHTMQALGYKMSTSKTELRNMDSNLVVKVAFMNSKKHKARPNLLLDRF